MRVYAGGARRDYEETLRSIGATLDDHMLREMLLLEVDEGFFVQGLALEQSSRARTSVGAIAVRRELTFFDTDIAGQIDAAAKRRGTPHTGGRLETALRALGRYVDRVDGHGLLVVEQQDGFVLRLTAGNQIVEPYRLTALGAEELLRSLGESGRDRR